MRNMENINQALIDETYEYRGYKIRIKIVPHPDVSIRFSYLGWVDNVPQPNPIYKRLEWGSYYKAGEAIRWGKIALETSIDELLEDLNLL